MVHKRRPLKGTQGISEPQSKSLSVDCDENTLQSIVHNINALHQDVNLLDLESSLLPSPYLPVLDVDAAQIKHGQRSHSPFQSSDTKLFSRVSHLHLPRSVLPQPNASSPQHYILIPNRVLNHSARSPSRKNDVATSERLDGRSTIAMEAKREATVIKKVDKLMKRGLWSRNRLPKVMEPVQPLCHWDHLLEEARWLAEDYKQERMWKKAVAKKLAVAAKMFCLIRSELARRNEEELEELRRHGASIIAKMVRDWWAGVSETAGMLSLLSEQSQWRAALRQNRIFLTQLTKVGAHWVSEAVSRSPRPLTAPPLVASDMALDEEDVDNDWFPPQSSATTTASESVESLPDAEMHFNPDGFSWGLRASVMTPEPMHWDSSHSDDDSENHGSVSSASSAASMLTMDLEDVAGLISDSTLPLNEVLEPYMANGWSSQPFLTEARSVESQQDTSPVGAESPYQSIVNSLRYEAMLPLRQLLPFGYQPIFPSHGMNGTDGVSVRRRLAPRRSMRPVLLNGCLSHDESLEAVVDGVAEDDGDREGEIRSETSAEADFMEIDGCLSDSEMSVASSLVTAAQFRDAAVDATASMPQSLPPSELARRARALSQWRTHTPLRRLLHARLPAFGPTCRVPFLPTSNLYAGVFWLSTTYAQRVPTCLITYSTPSADAELCLAVHIGQLAASGSGGGDWGPHLLVCPRILLPSWRARLTAVCPGLRVLCVLANSRSGTGRRLKMRIARQNVHICLTTYAALRSRPSRFEGVQWHLIILDQVQHLINSPSFRVNDPTTPRTGTSEQSGVLGGGGGRSVDDLSVPTTSPVQPLPDAPVLSELVQVLLHRLLPSARQRVCIFTDICESHVAHLKTLLTLLLHSPHFTTRANDVGVVEETVRQASLIKPEPGAVTTRDEVVRALEPFLYRFIDEEDDDDDEEDESATKSSGRIEDLVRIEIISDHLTDDQRALHDRILTDKTCERAVRSGHLTDLLACLSAGARICSHPWLLSGSEETPQWLAQDRQPAFSPPLFLVPGLSFDSPASLLELRRAVAEDGFASPFPLMHLPSTLRAPAHVRSRLVQLLPSTEQLKQAFVVHGPSKRSSEDLQRPVWPSKRRREDGTEKIAEDSQDEEPFITPQALRTVILETAKALFAANKASTEPMDVQPIPPVVTNPVLPPKTDSKEQNASIPPNAVLSAETKNRLHQLLWQCQRTRLELEGHADWCSAATMDRIHALSREPSLLPSGVNVFPALPFIGSSASTSPSSALCRIVRHRFDQLPLLSSQFGLLCTRDKAVGLPPLLTDTSSCIPSPRDVEAAIDRFYPLLPSARWLSPHTMPHRLPHFLTASGKIQRLRSLLLNLIRSPPQLSETEHPQEQKSRHSLCRPRVIFILSHRTSFLNLLAAWLSVDPHFASLSCLRAPIDHLDIDNGEASSMVTDEFGDGRTFWMEQVNAWPSGTQGPLLVLLHGRSPPLSVAGLRAGPDTRLVICDADWRKDVVSVVKSKSKKRGVIDRLRCWSINGLVDVPSKTRYNSSVPPLLHVYRLVTEWESGESIEARIVKSTAIQLLPDSVFMTASPSATVAATSSRSRGAAALPALPPPPPCPRVQPNVVQQLVSCLRRRALWRCKAALSPPQPQASLFTLSSVSTATSIPPLDSDGVEEEATTTQDEESDTASLFHNREPIQRDMLIQCFDLHEAPRDVQTWYSSLAETTAIVAEMHGDDLASQVEAMVPLPAAEDAIYHADSSCGLLSHQPALCLADPEVLETWELDQASWRDTLETVESITMGEGEPLFYLPPQGDAVDAADDGFADENDLPIVDAFKLPLWVPSFFEDPEFRKTPLPAPFDKVDVAANNATTTFSVAESRTRFSSAGATWGYASEPMTEAELPPLLATVLPLFDSTNTTAVRSSGGVSGAAAPAAGGGGGGISLSAKSTNGTASTAMTYALKRSAAASLTARNSVGANGVGATAPPSKKRKLTGAAAMAARRAASNKAAAAAAAAAAASANSSAAVGRVPHLEGNEKPLLGASVQDRSDPAASASSAAGAAANVSSIANSTIAPAAAATSFTVTLSSSHRVSIPRAFFSRDLRAIAGGAVGASCQGATSGSGSSGATSTFFTPAPRIRRVASSASAANSARLAGSGGASNPAVVGGVAGGVAGVFSALNNPHLLAKYAISSAGKSTSASLTSVQRQGLHASPGLVSFKFGPSSTAGHLQSSFSDAKPPEWSPLEEAALLMCTNKLQDIPLSSGNSHQHQHHHPLPHQQHHCHHQAVVVAASASRMPNFRLVEFFLNSFNATRAYRSCRQCLLAYYRILSALVTSPVADLLPSCDEDKLGPAYTHQLQHPQQQHQHGATTSVGRKVKNKLKSGLSASLTSSSSTGLLGHNSSLVSGAGVSNDSNAASAGVSASSANRLRGYQFFLYLQSQLSSLSAVSAQSSGGSVGPTASVTTTSPVDNQVVGLLRKCVREATNKPTGTSGLHHLHHLHHHHHHHHSGSGALVPPHHPQTQTQVQQRMGGPATAATMLMRNAAAAAAAATAAVAASTSQTPPPPQLPSGAAVIQKNPSHIAALQEHNISPDTLITPAMVIKSKEEREARQRTEAAAAAAAASSASSTPSSVSSIAVVATSTSSVVASGSSPVVVGSANAAGLVPAARVHHYSHQQQHPTIVTISGTNSPGGGPAIQRSANILPFSSATPVSYHSGSGTSPTVFRYNSPGSMAATARQVPSSTAAPTGILRRVGPGVVGGNAQSVFAVTPATGAGATHVMSNDTVFQSPEPPSNSGATTMVRRGVTLTPTGAPQAGGGAGGVTVLATASGARPASVIYQHHQTAAAAPSGITLLPAGTQALPQIIRARQQFRPGTPLPTQRFVRTLPATPTGGGGGLTPGGGATATTALVHRTRDGLFTSPVQQQQRGGGGGGGGVVVPESQLLLSRIHSVPGAPRRPPTAIKSGGRQQGQPPQSSPSTSSSQPQ